jgi:hypothetical protein
MRLIVPGTLSVGGTKAFTPDALVMFRRQRERRFVVTAHAGRTPLQSKGTLGPAQQPALGLVARGELRQDVSNIVSEALGDRRPRRAPVVHVADDVFAVAYTHENRVGQPLSRDGYRALSSSRDYDLRVDLVGPGHPVLLRGEERSLSVGDVELLQLYLQRWAKGDVRPCQPEALMKAHSKDAARKAFGRMKKKLGKTLAFKGTQGVGFTFGPDESTTFCIIDKPPT